MEPSRCPHSSSMPIPPSASSGGIRGRTQNVADALLNAKAPTRSRLPCASSACNASNPSSATSTRKPVNPYSQSRSLVRNPGHSRGLSSKKPTSLPSEPNNIRQDATRISNSSTKKHIEYSSKSGPSASSFFQRRNARDTNSKDSAPPPTATDLTLLTLLDGPKKKTVKSTIRSGLKQPTSLAPQTKAPMQTLQQKKKCPIDSANNPKRKIDCTASTAKRQKGSSGSHGGVILPPPPPPSYSLQTGASKRPHGVSSIHGKGRSSHSTEPIDIGRQMKCKVVNPRKRVSSHATYLTSDSDQSKTPNFNALSRRNSSSKEKVVEETAVIESLENCQGSTGTNDRTKSKREEEICKISIGHEINNQIPKKSQLGSPSQTMMSSGYLVSNPYKKHKSLDGDDIASVQHGQLIDDEETVSGVNVESSIKAEKRSDATITPKDEENPSHCEKQIYSALQNELSLRSSPSELDGNIRNQPEKGESRVGDTSTNIVDDVRSKSNLGTSSLVHELSPEPDESSPNSPVLPSISNEKVRKYAEWYDQEEHSEMEKQSMKSSYCKHESNHKVSKSKGKKGRTTTARINDNFVRLDLRNSAGSCRGARNLKKLNKQKHWRARHRFGMNDPAAEDDSDGDEFADGVDVLRKRSHANRTTSNGAANGGDLKCFASAKNAGVDPLDDYIDGVFSGGKDFKESISSVKEKGEESTTIESRAPKRDESVPLCTRHQRPCKLLTVKKNVKGNKGRKFFVCSMPKGEQCDFFKWEEDTIEATQRALLQSSSDSGFIARQVAAFKKRFGELTVPELRMEAKKRGLKGTGKKDQILTRLLIWARDDIAASFEPTDKESNDSCASFEAIQADVSDNGQDKLRNKSDDGCNDTERAVITKDSEMIDLSDSECTDDESYDDDSSVDELKIISANNTNVHVHPSDKDFSEKPESCLNEALLHYFGYSGFREGQEWTIRRCLTNQRTLLVAATGQGKSLCYALPAALMEGLCLVVSPLISLMQDQLRQLPPKIPAATLSGSMTQAQMALVIDDILRGRYKILFVSPERLASAAFRRLFRPKFNVETRRHERQFPIVSLLCVDEAHCLSQWGHNFRPSYLRMKSLLPLIAPKSVLALTATAGPMVVRDICNTLHIPYDKANACLPSPSSTSSAIQCNSNCENAFSGVKILNCNRDNIDVFTLVLETNDERRYLLHKILAEKKSDDPRKHRNKNLPVEEGCLSKGSVIVYVWRQKDTEIVAEQLNGAGVSGGVVCYHGGMDSNDRARAQSSFLRGKARICVATVAFGLGINKPDIVGVIHLCLPPSPEHYLQEIGRAGRDGRPARAIALPLVEEVVSRHSLAHSDRISKSQLGIIFSTLQSAVEEATDDILPDAEKKNDVDNFAFDDVHVAVPVMNSVESSDCKEESIETIFSLLEEDSDLSPALLRVEGYLPDVATITLKRRNLDQLVRVEEIARSILKCGIRLDESKQDSGQNSFSNASNRYPDIGGTAMEKGFLAYSFGTYKFSVIRAARCTGATTEPRHVYAALRRLQDAGELELNLDTTQRGRAMHLRLKQEGIRILCKRNGFSDTKTFENIIGKLMEHFLSKEKVTVSKVQSVHDIMHRVSSEAVNEGVDECGDENDYDVDGTSEKSTRLATFQQLIQNYFENGKIDDNKRDDFLSTMDSSKTPVIVKEFPLDNTQLLSFFHSDITSLIQLLKERHQERLPTAVHIHESPFSDYRDLCIAKILHGIDAPRAPILNWYTHPLWGKYRSYSFSSVLQAVVISLRNEN